MNPVLVLTSCVALLCSTLASASLTVTTTLDSGDGSLRQAILDANDSAGADVIDFDIPAESCSPAGVCSIRLASILPVVTDAVLIDGTTQPRHGAAPLNVCASRSAPSYMRVQVELIPSTNDYFLVVDSPGASRIRGLSLMARRVVDLQSAGAHHISCNHIGLNGPGDAVGLGTDGILVSGSARGAIIGTNGDGVGDVGERNVFGGVSNGIYVNANDDNWIAGNYLGFGADGVTPFPHVYAIFIRQSSSRNLVGTDGNGVSDDIERNIIGNSRARAVTVDGYAADGNEIVGNEIGVDAAGEPAGNAIGIYVSYMEGSALIRGNYIGSSLETGISILNAAVLASPSEGNCLDDNEVGFEHEGSEDLAFEWNWWGEVDGPSGVGPGNGDSLILSGTGTVDYAPWFAPAAESCLVPEPSQHALGAAAMGVMAILRAFGRRSSATGARTCTGARASSPSCPGPTRCPREGRRRARGSSQA